MPTIDYMAQPVGVAIPAFDVATGEQTQNILFSFTVRGGQQVLSNTLRIYVNDGSTNPIFVSTVTSYTYNQSISTQLLYNYGLRNNREYLFTFQTHGRGIVGYQDEEPIYDDIDSIESSPILFKTYATPVLQFTNLPLPVSNISTIQMANYTFDCQYTQSGGELLSSLYFYMYDYNHTLIDTSKLYTSNDAINPNPSPQDGMLFEYTYQGFSDDTDYYIKVVATTVNNTVIEIEAHLHIDYKYDSGYFNIKATNFANGGYVEIINNVTEIDGYITNVNDEPTTPQYLSDNYVILESDTLHFDEGYQISSDAFVKQKWWFPVLLGETTKFYNTTGQYLTIEFKRGLKNNVVYDYIEVTQHDNLQTKRKTSNLIPAVNQQTQLKTYVSVNGDVITAQIAKAEITSSAYWNGESSIIPDSVPTNLIWLGESGDNSDESYIDIDDFESNVEWGRITNMFWGIEGDSNREPLAPPLIEYNDTNHLSQTTYIKTSLQNAVINEFYVTRDLSQSMLSEFPEWDNATIMLAEFNGNIIAGNVTWLLGSVDNIKLKRKLASDTTNHWITLLQKDVTSAYDLGFTYRDYYVPSNNNYIYAMVPCMGNNEQSYFTTKITTKFNGLFVSDKDQTLKLYSNYGVTSAQDNILVGILQPYKSIYPTINKNPNVHYRTVTFSGDILGLNYNADDDNCIQTNFELTEKTRLDIVLESDTWRNFLCNGKTKIIRDWNGNIIMAQVTTPPSRTYDKNSGNSKPTMTFGVTEVGDSNSQTDLFKHGLIDVEV